MKLLEAIEKGIVKEFDIVEVSFKARILKSNFVNLKDRLELRLIPEISGLTILKKEMEEIELIQNSTEESKERDAVIGKTFKLSEAKEHLKVGMKVSVWCEDFEEGKEPYIEGEINDLSPTHFNVKRDNEYSSASIQWFPRKWTVKIISDTTCKKDSQVEEDPVKKEGTNFIAEMNETEKELFSVVSGCAERLAILEKQLVETNRNLHRHKDVIWQHIGRIGNLEDKITSQGRTIKDNSKSIDRLIDSFSDHSISINDHTERIDELEDKVQKIFKMIGTPYLGEKTIIERLDNLEDFADAIEVSKGDT